MTFNLQTAIKYKPLYSQHNSKNMVEDFYIPVLSNAIEYDRVCGYFSSTSLSLASRGFSKFCENPRAKMRLIAGAKLFPSDVQTILQNQNTLNNVITQKISEELEQSRESPDFEQDRLKGLAWMIKNGVLEIKIGIMLDSNGRIFSHDEAEFHHKYGIVRDSYAKTANIIHFMGSLNESRRSWLENGDSINVHRSWIPGQKEFIHAAIDEFDKLWYTNGKNLNLKVAIVPLPYAIKNNWIKYFSPIHPSTVNELHTSKINNVQQDFVLEKKNNSKWIHQDDAVKWFLTPNKANGVGLLMMATGTGKTRTALKIVQEMFDKNLIDAVVINTRERLLEQWDKEMSKGLAKWRRYSYWHNSEKKQSEMFFLNKNRGRCLMITYYFLPDVIDRIPPSRLERILLIVDEIHNIGSEQNVIKMNISENDKKYLTSDATDVPLTKPEFAGIMNQYKKFYYRLGLSATPFSDFDDERNQFIINSFMQHPVIINKTPDWKIKIIKEKKIFYFGLEDAIKKGILCPFEYIPLKYKPSVQDLEERKRVLKVWSLKVKNGEASPEAPYIMAANVLKASRNKIPVFKKYLNKCSKKILKRCIIFVQTTDYGKDICNLINGYTKDYHEFFSDDEKENLVEFGIGNLEVLITCHMISEGVDIKSVSNIVLFSSDRQQLETIQRIGRALRTDPSNPSKISKVIDFVYLEEDKSDSADKIRMEWLSYLAKIRPEGR